MPAGGASAGRVAKVARRARAPSSRFGPNGVVIVNAVRSPFVVAARTVAVKRSRGPFGSA